MTPPRPDAPSRAMDWLAVAWPTWTPRRRALAAAYVALRVAAGAVGAGRESLALHLVHAVYRTTERSTP